MVRREAFPLSGDAGIGEIRDMVAKDALPSAAATKGSLTHQDVLDDYVGHVMSFIDEKAITPFNVVLDAGSGMAGLVGPKLVARIPTRKLTTLCFEVDGRFPNHGPIPDRREPP
jgi:phosphomannomutase